MKITDEIATVEDAQAAYSRRIVDVLQVAQYLNLGYKYVSIECEGGDEFYMEFVSPSGISMQTHLYENSRQYPFGEQHFKLCMTKIALRMFDALSEQEPVTANEDR